ncbi:MAG: hypothetical protein WBP64_02215 [Nitrososphaeraceae archaeon]
MPDLVELLLLHSKSVPIMKWLRLKIHQHGSVYAPKVLLNNTFNEGYNPDYFVTYIETKYLGS